MAPRYVLGISAFYHDSAACLLRDGDIAAAAQEERFTRTKGDASFPRHSVRYCLQTAGIRPADLAYVGFNTSFNVRSEPIVCTPADAYRCFMRTHIDHLALGPFLLDKTRQPAWKESGEWQQEFQLD